MGSPLSGVLACLYLEFLEFQPFKHILPNDIQYFRYIDDILIIYSKEHNIFQIVQKLNQVERSINFTYQLEKNTFLLFLDNLLINNNKLEFKVYYKINNKNDYIHFYSNQSDKTKSGILIGFFLRAFRICSPYFSNKEFEYIHNFFSKLQYSESFTHRAKSKAMNIHKRTSHYMNKNKLNSNTNPKKRHIILSPNPTTTLIEKNLNHLCIKTTIRTKKKKKKTNKKTATIKQIIKNNSKITNSKSTKSASKIAINFTKEK